MYTYIEELDEITDGKTHSIKQKTRVYQAASQQVKMK